MTRLTFLLITSVAMIYSSQAEAKKADEPLRLSPTSKWVAEYQNEGCRLIRQFGTDKNQVVVTFNRYGPDEHFQLTLAGQPFRLNSNGVLEFQFGPTESEQRVDYWVGSLGEQMPAIVLKSTIRLAPPTEAEKQLLEDDKSSDSIVLPPLGAAREKAVNYLLARKPLRKPILLELGNMDRPLAALNKCVDDLMGNWGIDVEKHKSLKQKVTPIGDPGSWIVSNDYPLKMLNERQPSLVDFRLDVDETGMATSCHIQETTRAKEFDNAVCRSLMRRAKFSPAIDADGTPIRSYWKSRVRFQIAGM